MIYGFYLFSRKGSCLYSEEFVQFEQRGTSKEREKFLFGLLRTIKNFCHFVSHEPKDNVVRVVTTASFRLHILMTVTGLRFVILSGLETPRLDQTLHYLYQLYCEYVLKNPLYHVGDIIECQTFSKQVSKHLKGDNAQVYNFNEKTKMYK